MCIRDSDITNPPSVEFEQEYKLDTAYGSGIRVQYPKTDYTTNPNAPINGRRYRSLNAGTSSPTVYPTHTVGIQTVGNIDWLYEGESADASVVLSGSVTSINVTNGGSGYTTQPIVSIVGGGATSGNQAFATAQITDGSVTAVSYTHLTLPTICSV